MNNINNLLDVADFKAEVIKKLTDFYIHGEEKNYSNAELSRIRSCITKIEETTIYKQKIDMKIIKTIHELLALLADKKTIYFERGGQRYVYEPVSIFKASLGELLHRIENADLFTEN